jgi:hypothetical protein
MPACRQAGFAYAMTGSSMAVIVKIIGVAITLLGIVYIVSPVTIKVWLKFWETGRRPAWAVLVSFSVGVLFLASADKCTISWIPSAIGALCIVKSIVFLIYGPKRLLMKAWIWFDQRIALIRFLGFIPVALGIMLIIAV